MIRRNHHSTQQQVTKSDHPPPQVIPPNKEKTEAHRSRAEGTICLQMLGTASGHRRGPENFLPSNRKGCQGTPPSPRPLRFPRNDTPHSPQLRYQGGPPPRLTTSGDRYRGNRGARRAGSSGESPSTCKARTVTMTTSTREGPSPPFPSPCPSGGRRRRRVTSLGTPPSGPSPPWATATRSRE